MLGNDHVLNNPNVSVTGGTGVTFHLFNSATLKDTHYDLYIRSAVHANARIVRLAARSVFGSTCR